MSGCWSIWVRRRKQAAKLHAEAKELRRKLRGALGQASSRSRGFSLQRRNVCGSPSSQTFHAAGGSPTFDQDAPSSVSVEVKESQNILLMAEAPSRPVRRRPRRRQGCHRRVTRLEKQSFWSMTEFCVLLAELKRIHEGMYSEGLAVAHEQRTLISRTPTKKTKRRTRGSFPSGGLGGNCSARRMKT
jgi:hypothetical protein